VLNLRGGGVKVELNTFLVFGCVVLSGSNQDA
jgi:hypothetical protein